MGQLAAVLTQGARPAAGAVFYEALLATGSDLVWANHVYFAATTLTFALVSV